MISRKNTWGGCGIITEVPTGIKNDERYQSNTLLSCIKVTSNTSLTLRVLFI